VRYLKSDERYLEEANCKSGNDEQIVVSSDEEEQETADTQ
jgi:hypothetical protein